MKKIRVDQLMVQKELVESRETAQRLILAHKVMIGDKYVEKPGQQVAEDADVRVLEPLKYVSRGGYKLEHALEAFGVDVAGKTVLDVGASTGGFTDCLLQRGARKVFALDVGYGQIAWKLREDPRVILMERTNARFLTPDLFSESIDLAVMDVSFISAAKILEPLANITREIVFLFKPQFEAGPQDVPRGGVIKDHRIHVKVLQQFFSGLTRWNVAALAPSPIAGGSGNREFLFHLTLDRPGLTEGQILARIQEVTTPEK